MARAPRRQYRQHGRAPKTGNQGPAQQKWDSFLNLLRIEVHLQDKPEGRVIPRQETGKEVRSKVCSYKNPF